MATHERSELRRFGVVMAAGFGLIAAVLLWRHRPAGPVLAALAVAFLAAAALAPRVLAPVRAGWMKLAGWLSVGMTYVILTLTFFLVVTPLGLLLRLLGKDLLHRKIDRGATSYWVAVERDGPGSRPRQPY